MLLLLRLPYTDSGCVGGVGWKERRFLQGAAERRGLFGVGPGALRVLVHAQVLLERLLVAEALAAVSAGIGVLARVHALVLQQVLPAGKGLQALGAAMAPLPVDMAGLVAEEGLGVAEVLPTLPARVQLGPGLVHAALVFHKVVSPHEALVALPAPVGALARVDPVVVGQLGLLGEALLALGALVGLLPGVRAGVVVQVLLADEGLAALWALKGPGPLPVGLLVDHQARLAVEGFVALRTLVGPLGVAGLVPGELPLVTEATATVGADERTVAFPHSVGSLVDQQAGLEAEALRAQGAGMRPSRCLGQGLVTQTAVLLTAGKGFRHLLGPGLKHQHCALPVQLLSHMGFLAQGALRLASKAFLPLDAPTQCTFEEGFWLGCLQVTAAPLALGRLLQPLYRMGRWLPPRAALPGTLPFWLWVMEHIVPGHPRQHPTAWQGEAGPLCSAALLTFDHHAVICTGDKVHPGTVRTTQLAKTPFPFPHPRQKQLFWAKISRVPWEED